MFPTGFIKDLALGVVRHFATAAAGALVADGIIQASQQNDLIGSVLFIAGVVASGVDKYLRSKGASNGQKPSS